MRITGQILKAVYPFSYYCTTETFMHIPRQDLFKRGCPLRFCICMFK